MPKVHVKKGDTVIVISGEDKGKKGKVLKVMPNEKKILVEGINVVTKHKKKRLFTVPRFCFIAILAVKV
mgnify:CR=1 FL=1